MNSQSNQFLIILVSIIAGSTCLVFFFPQLLEQTNHVDRVVDEEYGVVCYADRTSGGFQCLHLFDWEEERVVEVKTLNNRSMSWQQLQRK